MSDEPKIEYGLCCNCYVNRATGVCFINRRSPTPGKGWGCYVCKLPPDGAMAVLCDECAEGLAKREGEPRYICTGDPAEPDRTPFFDLSPEPFEHDLSMHAAHMAALQNGEP